MIVASWSESKPPVSGGRSSGSGASAASISPAHPYSTSRFIHRSAQTNSSIDCEDASSAAVREWVAERRARFEETLAHDLYASGAELVRLDASGDFAEPLVAFFRRRAHR